MLPSVDGSWENIYRIVKQRRMRMGTRWMDLSDCEFRRIGFSVLISLAEADAVESASGKNPLFSFSSALRTFTGDPSDCLCISQGDEGRVMEKKRAVTAVDSRPGVGRSVITDIFLFIF